MAIVFKPNKPAFSFFFLFQPRCQGERIVIETLKKPQVGKNEKNSKKKSATSGGKRPPKKTKKKK
jgi:hypothetical protein